MPLIAITRGSDLPRFSDQYIQSIEGAGGTASFISLESLSRTSIDVYDGFLIPGGKDVHPLFYGEEEIHRSDYETIVRMNLEIFMLRKICSSQKPVLGICYGMQLINVFFGGSLFQDIGLQSGSPLDHSRGHHEIELSDNPFLDAGYFTVNSSHHQAIKDFGVRLKPWAYSSDGIVEGIYHAGYDFMVGVQWHPERMSERLSNLLFRRFILACDI